MTQQNYPPESGEEGQQIPAAPEREPQQPAQRSQPQHQETPVYQGEPRQDAGQSGTEEEPFDKERAMATIRQLRQYERDAKELKRAVADAQAKLKAYEDREKSEFERLQERIATMEHERDTALSEAREARVRMAVTQAATRLDIIDAEAAYKLMDMRRVNIDEFGNVGGVEESLKELIMLRPFLKRQPVVRSGSEFGGNGSPGKPTIQEVEALAKSNPEEFNRRWEAGEFRDVFGGGA